MTWLWVLSPLALSPLVWVYLGRYTGDNRPVQALIHPPPLQAASKSRGRDAAAASGAGGNVGSGAKRPPRQRTRGLSFIATDRPTVNPFVNATPYLTSYERAKLSVMSVTLLPLRLVLGVSCLALAVMWLSVCTIGVPTKVLKSKPLPAWRRHLRFPTRLLTRLFMIIFGFYRVKQTGRRCKASEAAVIVPNHVSFIEPLYLGGVHMLSAVSRAENGKMPLIGRGLMALQCILVDRFDPQSRQNTKDAIKRRAVPGQGWGQFMIFPEGTTCNTQAVISFAMGAFSPGQPVQPVAIRYPFQNFDPCWVVQGPGILGLSMRMLCQFVNHMEVTWLPVYKPSAEERSDAKLFARNVQKTVAAALKVPTTDHSFSDVVLALEAQRRGVDPSAGAMVELTKLRSFLDVNVRTAQKYLDAFIALDTHKTGHMDLPTFAKIFGHGVTEEIKRLFELLDTDESGALDFREYLTGLSIINEEGKEGRKAALRLAFGMFDKDGSNRLPKAALQRILSRALPDLTDSQFEELWVEADRDHDGSISMDEFLAFAEAHEDVLPVFRREYL